MTKNEAAGMLEASPAAESGTCQTQSLDTEAAARNSAGGTRAFKPDDKWTWLLRQTGTVAEMSMMQSFVIACQSKATPVERGRRLVLAGERADMFPPFHVWLSNAEIARRTGLHERTIPGVSERLQQRGLIKAVGRYGTTGQIKVYQVLVHATGTPQKPSPFKTSESPKKPAPFDQPKTPQEPSLFNEAPTAPKTEASCTERPKVSASAYIEEKRNKKRESKSTKRSRKKSEELTFREWWEAWAASKPEGERFLPPDDPLHAWGEQMGLSYDFLCLAYNWFREYHLEEAPDKKQRDWRATFRKYVRQDYCKLWYRKDGAWHLNSKGKAAAIKHGYDENMTCGGSSDWTHGST